MEYIVSAIIGYLLGSFPTAYLILKKAKGIDITKNGSKNMGAMNSLKVSNSKSIGFVVFLIDFLKGILSVVIVGALFGYEFSYVITSLILAVLAHCYTPWLKFKGGRGLATAAGGALIISPPVLGLWLLFFVLAFLFRKSVHFGNSAATIMTIAIVLSSSGIINKYSSISAESDLLFGLSITVMLVIIMTRHIVPLVEYYKSQKVSVRDTK